MRRGGRVGAGTLTVRAAFVSLAVVLGAGSLRAQSAEEYRVKSVFLERFTRFVDWPENSPVNDTALPFVIGVIGRNPFGKILESDYGGHRIKGKEVVVEYYGSVGEIDSCHLLFIAGSEKSRLAAIVDRVGDKPVLTVGDSGGFARAGVHINFYRAGDKIRFEINAEALRKTGLDVASLLLDYARVVDGEEVE